MVVSGLNYTAMESALKSAFETHFSDRLATDTCQIADLDTAYQALSTYTLEEYNDMLVLDFAGGTDQPRRTFANIKCSIVVKKRGAAGNFHDYPFFIRSECISCSEKSGNARISKHGRIGLGFFW